MLEADNHYGKFEFKPLEPGYGGITVGNALRRILLNSLGVYAISLDPHRWCKSTNSTQSRSKGG